MNIIIVSHFSERLQGQNDGRFEYLANMLVNRGHNVKLLTSDFDHFTKKHRESVSDLYSYKIVLIHEIGYKTNVCFKRLYSHWRWGRNVFKYLAASKTPDVIYLAVPSLTVGVKTSYYCKRKNVRLIIDVQDLWPEAFCLAIKNKILQSILLPLEWYANKIYRAADFSIAVSDTYLARALKVCKTKTGISVFLGNDGERFDKAKMRVARKEHTGEIWLAYIGTLGASYDIPCVIDSLKILNNNHFEGGPKIKFRVIGDGPKRLEFTQYAQINGVDCEFTGGLTYEDMVKEMCECDIVVNPIMRGAAQSITNKVGDYALSGLPVVSTQENQEYRDLVDLYKCGINCECGNAQSLADAILKLANNSELRKKMGEASRKLGDDKFDRRHTYLLLVQAIETINNKNV